ncbi:MAG: glycosyltransferase [Thermoleophilaceae bacterium]
MKRRRNGPLPTVDERITVMIYSLQGGGAERMAVGLADALAETELVDLVVARAEGAFLAEVPPGVRLVDLRAGSAGAWLRRLVGYLRTTRPRALLAVMDTAGAIAVAARAIARSKVRIVVSSHNTFSLHAAHAPRWKERHLLPRAVSWLYPRADGIVALSEGVAQDLAKVARLPRSRITVIANPVVSDELVASAGAPVEHPWFGDGEPPVLLAAGRLTEQKDYPTLLRAFSAARQKRRLRLVILGEGEARPALTRLAGELGVDADVDMAGFVMNPYAYMARASAFVLSSAWEGFGNVLVEALACGTPVVSTDCPSGPSEILDSGRYGRLVPVGDHRALASAILATLDDPVDATVLRARASSFRMDGIIDRYRMVLGL